MANLAKVIFTMQDQSTANGNGEELSIATDMNSANVEIVSTSTTANVNFEAQTASETWHSINGVNLETFNVSRTTPAVNSVYQIDLTGFSSVRVRISDMTNGEVTVIARVVS